MTDRIPITRAGFDKLRADLKRLKEVERPKIIAAIEEARGHGDLSENAEYDAAKERQGLLEERIRLLETRLAGAQVIDPTTLSGDRVVFGATVQLSDASNGKEVTYQIVGPDEADIKDGTISVGSPMARALIGREPGDVVKVQAPGGVRKYEIVDVSFGTDPQAAARKRD